MKNVKIESGKSNCIHALPEREGGGGAPTFFCVKDGWRVLKKVERELETDPQGHCRAGMKLWRAPAGHAKAFICLYGGFLMSGLFFSLILSYF